jgi:hypothetical protein
MSHAIDNKSIKHDQSAERLITKLILNPTLVRSERNNERVKLIDTFMEEYGDVPTSVECLLVSIFRLWPSMNMQRPTNGITSIP